VKDYLGDWRVGIVQSVIEKQMKAHIQFDGCSSKQDDVKYNLFQAIHDMAIPAMAGKLCLFAKNILIIASDLDHFLKFLPFFPLIVLHATQTNLFLLFLLFVVVYSCQL